MTSRKEVSEKILEKLAEIGFNQNSRNSDDKNSLESSAINVIEYLIWEYEDEKYSSRYNVPIIS